MSQDVLNNKSLEYIPSKEKGKEMEIKEEEGQEQEVAEEEE